MRADRLVAILLMLQHRGQVTAGQVAAELEVSERTARRDLDALAMAGVPIYSQAGRGGGWRLAGGGRIDLSGLSGPEARALFLVAGPTAGATPEVRAALRKLMRALPEPLRVGAEAAADAVVVDSTGWDRTEVPTPPLLDQVQAAVVDREAIRIGYSGRDGRDSDRTVEPFGLVSKGRSWYLVAGTERGRRTFRVDRITSVERTGGAVQRPEGFDLQAEWRRIVAEVDQMRTPVVVAATAQARAVGYLRAAFGSRVVSVEPAEDDETASVVLRGHSIASMAAELAGFASMVEVHEPSELRDALGVIGRELVSTYGEGQVPQEV